MKKMKDLAMSLESDLLSPSSILTPSTVKSITQLLESQDCLKAVQNYEKTGLVNDVEDKKTFFNSTGFNGGTTTILTSTAFQVTADSETAEEVEDCLPEPVVQTNRRMLTRSLSRTLGNAANPEHGQSFTNKRTRDDDPDYEPESPPPRKTRRGNPGAGRKSALRQHYEEENLSPEERERLRIRRLRNKEAAARCRKRRVDQTNSLQKEVELWMKKKEELEEEIQQLKIERDNLTFVLQSHCANPGVCALVGTRVQNPAVVATAVPVTTAPIQIPVTVSRLNANSTVAIKSEPVVVVEPVNAPYMLPETINFITAKEEVTEDLPEEEHEPLEKKPQRPSTLGLPTKPNIKGLEDVTIETPSRNVPNLSFDAFIATGFTPSTAAANTTLVNSIAPTASQQSLNTPSGCSSQQRSSGCPDLSTPIGDAAYLVQSL